MKVNLQVNLYDYKSNTGYDISNAVSDLEITTHIVNDPGKAVFYIVKPDKTLSFGEGAGVEIRLNGRGVFKGYVFEKEITENKFKMKVTCYDQLRYLKNKDAMVFKKKRSDQIFTQICKKYVLKHKVVDKSKYVCTPRSEDNVTLYEMIQNALDDTLINTGEWYVIIDDFGTLKHINVYSLQPQILISDSSGLTSFTYTTSIDKESYDQIALYRDDQKKGKRKVVVINDTSKKGENKGKHMKEWGVLQLYEKVDESVTDAGMRSKAKKLLSLYNHKSRTLTLKAVGNNKVRAGCLLEVDIEKMPGMNIKNEVVLVTDCTHHIKDSMHTMDLTVTVMQKG